MGVIGVPVVSSVGISLPRMSNPIIDVPRSTPSPSWGSYGYGGSCPQGWNAKVENFCTIPAVLQCCEQVIGGAAGEPDATATGCMSVELRLYRSISSHAISGTSAMAGGQVTYEFGFCPADKLPLCCAVVVSLIMPSLRSL